MNTFAALRSIHRLPIPAEHRLLLSHMALLADADGIAWPRSARLARDLAMTESRASWIVMELVECGLLRRSEVDGRGRASRDAYIVLTEVAVEAANPLAGLLLRERLWHIEGLTHGERWALMAISLLYDWDLGVARVSYRRVCASMPFMRDLTSEGWRACLRRLQLRGLVELVERGANQHSPSSYRILLDPESQVATGSSGVTPRHATGSSGVTPRHATGSSGVTPRHATGSSGVTPRHATEPRHLYSDRLDDRLGDRPSPPQPPAGKVGGQPSGSVTITDESTISFVSRIAEAIRDTGETVSADPHDYPATRRALLDTSTSGLSHSWAARLARRIEEVSPRSVDRLLAAMVRQHADLGDDLTVEDRPQEPDTPGIPGAPEADPTAMRLWKKGLKILQTRVSPAIYDLWFRDTVGLAYGDRGMVVGAPDDFKAEMIEGCLLTPVQRSMATVVGREVAVRIVSMDIDMRGDDTLARRDVQHEISTPWSDPWRL